MIGLATSLASAWLVAAGVVAPAPVTAEVAPSTVAPEQQREMTRVAGVFRPFLGLVGNTWGSFSEARVEHYFARPFMLGVELSPLAVAVDNRGVGVITHVRLHAAYVTDLLAVGFGIGERLRHFGASGVSLAPTVRLGALDGLHLSLAYVYTVARNRYTGAPTLGFSNIAGTLAVPLSRRLALTWDAGFSLDVWVFTSLSLRQRLAGEGGRGTWFVSGGFGFAWVSDRTVCNFNAEVPCTGSSVLAYGPTVSLGLERRF